MDKNSQSKWLLSLPSIWFGGLVIFLSIISNLSKKIDLNIKIINSDWTIYTFTFVVSVIIFFLSFYFSKKSKLKRLFSLFFYFFVIYNIEFSKDIIIISLISIFFYYTYFYKKNKISIYKKIESFFLIFLIFYISFKIIYWTDLSNFFFLDMDYLNRDLDSSHAILVTIFNFVINNKNGYILKFIFEIIFPISIFFVFVTSIFLISSYNKKMAVSKKYFIYLIPPVIFFFFESFNTHNFFNLGALAHWQVLVGPLELMNSGGWLLWDVPSQYGFLSVLAIYSLPFNSPWYSFYVLNSCLVFFMSLQIFYVIWNNRNIYWYIISLILSLGLIFYLNHGHEVENVNLVPSDGAFRYFWAITFLFVLFQIKSLDFFKQFLIILPVWLIGFFWSPESAFYVTAALGPMLIKYILNYNDSSVKKILIILLFPLSIIFFVILISFFYLINIGNLPDYYSFFEYVFSWVSGVPDYSEENFNYKGSVILLIFFLSIFFKMYFENINDKNSYLIFSVFCCVGAISSYLIGQSIDVNINTHLVYYVFGFFLILNHFSSLKRYYLIITPILIVIIITSYGNIKTLEHVFYVIKNQDYFFKNIYFEKTNGIDEIFNIAEIKNMPVVIHKPDRYLIYDMQNKYLNTKTNLFNKINKTPWIPYKPAGLFEPLNDQRRKIYLERWLNRNQTSGGWYMSSIEASEPYGKLKKIHWHNGIEESLFQVLKEKKFVILEEKKTDLFKAYLFSKNN